MRSGTSARSTKQNCLPRRPRARSRLRFASIAELQAIKVFRFQVALSHVSLTACSISMEQSIVDATKQDRPIGYLNDVVQELAHHTITSCSTRRQCLVIGSQISAAPFRVLTDGSPRRLGADVLGTVMYPTAHRKVSFAHLTRFAHVSTLLLLVYAGFMQQLCHCIQPQILWTWRCAVLRQFSRPCNWYLCDTTDAVARSEIFLRTYRYTHQLA